MNNTQFNNALVITKRQEKALQSAKANKFSSILRLARILDHIKGDKKSISKKMLIEYALQFIDRRRRADALKLLSIIQNDFARFWELYRSGRFTSVHGFLNEYRKLNKPAKGETSKGETSKGDSNPELPEVFEGMTAVEMSAFVAAWCEKKNVPVADVFRPILTNKTMLKMAMHPTKKAA